MAAPPITERHLPHFHRRQPIKEAVRVATTANITISTALNNGDTLDGITLATDDRVLVKDQSTGSQNGIYIVAASPVRAYDQSTDDPAFGFLVYVREGTANTGTLWKNTNTTTPTIGSTSLTFSQFSSSVSFATPAIVLGTAAAAGAASTVIRSDSTIVAFDATAPVTQALGDSAATGSAAVAARRDHKHGMPALSTATPIVASGSGATGTALPSSREDHVHPAGAGSGTLTTIEEVDGSPTDSAVTKLVFPNGTLAIASHVATYTPTGGGGGSTVDWTLVVNESGASFANWTSLVGTWASDGTNITQTAVSTTFKSAQLTAQVPFGFGPVIAECEVRFPTSGQGTGTFVHGGIVVGTIGILLNEGTTKQVHWQNYGVSDVRTIVTTIALDTWYKIRVVLSGSIATVYKDGVLIGTTYTPSAVAFDFLYLGSYNSKLDFRNIKVWLLSTGAPA